MGIGKFWKKVYQYCYLLEQIKLTENSVKDSTGIVIKNSTGWACKSCMVFFAVNILLKIIFFLCSKEQIIKVSYFLPYYFETTSFLRFSRKLFFISPIFQLQAPMTLNLVFPTLQKCDIHTSTQNRPISWILQMKWIITQKTY